MPPPITPSPRRFLPSSKSNKESQAVRPPSSLRHPPLPSSSSQFAPTPRFSIPSKPPKNDDIQSPSSSPLVARTRKPIEPRMNGDDIEDVLSSQHSLAKDEASDEDEMLLDSVELGLPSPKRRRTHSPPPRNFPGQRQRHEADPIVISSSPGRGYRDSLSPGPRPKEPQSLQDAQNLSNPEPIADHSCNPADLNQGQGPAPRTPHRPPHRRIASSSTNPFVPGPSRPTFKLPGPAPASATDADSSKQPPSPEILPEVFSPHRRGQRFQPGGLASTVRDWIVELANGGGIGKPLADRLGLAKAEDQARFEIKGVDPGGDARCTGVRVQGGQRWLLMSGGSGRGGGGKTGRDRVREGFVLVVQMPVWEVELEDVTWCVTVNWSVANPG